MATNPDELLIFKLRGMGKKAVAVQEEKPKVAEIKKEEPKAMAASAQVAQQPKAAIEAPKPIVQKPVEAKSPFSLFSKKEVVEEAPIVRTVKVDEEMLMKSVTKQPTAIERFEEPETSTEINKRSIDSEKAQMEAAAGLTCVNHPWRPAYAISAYSKMPYCYADLVEYSNKFYSVDDIDQVAGKEASRPRPMNSFIKIGATLFLVNSLILFYFTLPQLSFIAGYLSGVTPQNALGSLSSTYSIPLFNLTMAILGFLAGILILLTEERGLYLSGLVGTLILIGMSFEYLNSELAYLLGVSLIALIEIVLLAYGRVSATTGSYSRDIVAPDIEWPKVETF
ncbi:MAG: hypothetical protein KGH71_00180 [Candidatus Micrarchaeota archaeon]|nr:hypothetical protein [Candidatus Micrarchaeota archaeon]